VCAVSGGVPAWVRGIGGAGRAGRARCERVPARASRVRRERVRSGGGAGRHGGACGRRRARHHAPRDRPRRGLFLLILFVCADAMAPRVWWLCWVVVVVVVADGRCIFRRMTRWPLRRSGRAPS